MSDENSGFTALGAFVTILLILALVPAMAIYQGLALVKLWSWFLVPLIGRELSLVQATGIILIVNLVSGRSAIEKEYKDSEWSQIAWAIFTPVFILGCAWVIRSIL